MSGLFTAIKSYIVNEPVEPDGLFKLPEELSSFYGAVLYASKMTERVVALLKNKKAPNFFRKNGGSDFQFTVDRGLLHTDYRLIEDDDDDDDDDENDNKIVIDMFDLIEAFEAFETKEDHQSEALIDLCAGLLYAVSNPSALYREELDQEVEYFQTYSKNCGRTLVVMKNSDDSRTVSTKDATRLHDFISFEIKKTYKLSVTYGIITGGFSEKSFTGLCAVNYDCITFEDPNNLMFLESDPTSEGIQRQLKLGFFTAPLKSGEETVYENKFTKTSYPLSTSMVKGFNLTPLLFELLKLK